MPVELDHRLFTVEEYYKMAEVGILQKKRIELIKGEIINISPIGSKHSSCVSLLTKLLNRSLSDLYFLSAQNPIRLNNQTEPEPDITIAKTIDTLYSDRHPTPNDILAIFEVADSSLEYDREIKTRLYAEAGIPEYYIVNLSENIVEVYQDPKEGVYTKTSQVKKGEVLELKNQGVELNTADFLV